MGLFEASMHEKENGVADLFLNVTLGYMANPSQT